MQVVEGGAHNSKGSLLITGEIVSFSGFAWAGAMFFPGAMRWVPMSILYKMNGQIERTIEALEEGLKANPDATDLQYYLMSAYLDANQLEQFRIHLEELTQKNPDTPMIEEMRSTLTMHERLSASKQASAPLPARPVALPRNRMENPKPKHKKKRK